MYMKSTRVETSKLRWISAVLLIALLVNLWQPAAFAIMPVGNVLTGPAASTYGESVQFTAVITDAASGGSTPTGTVTFYDGGTPIGGVQTLAATEPTVTYKNGALAPAQPGKKLSCGANCPVIQWGGLTYWAYDDTDNNYYVYLYAYDANNSLVKSWQIGGNRYVNSITVDNSASRTVALNGQSGTTTRTWAELENFNAYASISIGNLPAGLHTITAIYAGDGNHEEQSSSLIHTVDQIQTNTSLTSNAGLIYVGEEITFTATVANSNGSPVVPGGTVTFKEGAHVLGTSGVNGSGVAVLSTSSLPVNGYSVTASYNGDSQHHSSTSSSLTQSVLGIPTTVSISASPGSATYGNAVTLTASVANSAISLLGPTGTVAFYDGANLLGTGTLSFGVTSITVPDLDIGSHQMTAQYGGSLTHLSNSSSSTPVVIQLIPTASTLSVTGGEGDEGDASPYGTSLTFTATVANTNGSALAPGGTVTFKDGGTILGTAALGAGRAVMTVPQLAAGVHSFKAEYSGDAKHGVSSSTAVPHTVNKAGTVITIAEPSPIEAGESVSWTVRVVNTVNNSLIPTGTVTFKQDGQAITPAAALDGSWEAAITLMGLPAGDRSIEAEYAGDANHLASTAAAVTQPVTKAPVHVQLSYTPQTGETVYGHLVTITVQVTNTGSGSSVPEGMVALSSTGGFNGWPNELTLTNGTATWQTDQLGIGTHTISVNYLGDADHHAGTSAGISLQVKPIPVAVEITSSVTEAVYYGTPVTFTAHVTNTGEEPQLPAGAIVFSGGNISAEPVVLDAAGYAELKTAALLPGTYTVQAAYVPDALHEAQVSDAVTQVVMPNTQGTTLILNHPSGVLRLDEPVLLSASVGGIVGDPTVTGHISLRENGAEVARVTTDVYGNANLRITGASSGTHRYKALYVREGMTNGTESQEVVVVVQPALTQLVLANGEYRLTLAAGESWLSAVVHGGSSPWNLHPVSAEAGNAVQVKRIEPVSGEAGTVVDLGSPIQLTEGINRFWIQVRSADGTASAEHIVSLFYQQTRWDISSVLAAMPFRYDMDGNRTFDKADLIELLKLIEPVSGVNR